VRMGENCQKQVRRVTKTGNSSTPKTQVKPCNGCGLGVFQGRLTTKDSVVVYFHINPLHWARMSPVQSD
ncbi:hypothetical protein, partial [Xanthomonas melonis]|uniref:hypothetical protein n=1 Tax=Xanthomonas melonis TaxID=56456 RepID=UPI003EB6ED17